MANRSILSLESFSFKRGEMQRKRRCQGCSDRKGEAVYYWEVDVTNNVQDPSTFSCHNCVDPNLRPDPEYPVCFECGKDVFCPCDICEEETGHEKMCCEFHSDHENGHNVGKTTDASPVGGEIGYHK